MDNSFIDMAPIIQYAHIYWKLCCIGLVFCFLLIKYTANGTLRFIISLGALYCIFNIMVALLF